MAYQKDNTDWISKEKRDLFCKAINTQIMSGAKEVDGMLDNAKKIVDKAFEYYPDGGKGESNKGFDVPVKNEDNIPF